MSSDPKQNPPSAESYDPRVVDLALGGLAAHERSELESLIAREAGLTRQHAELCGALTALESLRRLPAPPDLVDRTVARLKAAPSGLRVVGGGWSDDRGARIRSYSFRDITAVAAMVVLAVGIGVPGLVQMRDRASRTQCAANLGQIGQAMQAYASAFGDSMPFAGFVSGRNSWQPTRDPSLVRIPNRQHLYPLLATGNIGSPQWLICPSGREVALPAGHFARPGGFLEARNVSYATQNMAGVRPSRSASSRLVILADDNPMFDDGVPVFDLAARRLGLRDPSSSNSRAHRSAGQNVLSADGQVRWATTPSCGVDGDNIWTLTDTESYTGAEGPRTASDSHLLK